MRQIDDGDVGGDVGGGEVGGTPPAGQAPVKAKKKRDWVPYIVIGVILLIVVLASS